MSQQTTPAEPEHYHVGGQAGGPGENEAECACGTTHAEATAEMDRHIAQETGTAPVEPLPAASVKSGSSAAYTTPAGLAAALRHAAARIEQLGNIQFDPTILTVQLQAVTHEGTRVSRIATVDALNRALTGVPGEHGETDTLHATPYDVHFRDYYDVSVYTGLEDSALNPNRRKRDAERAPLKLDNAIAAAAALEPKPTGELAVCGCHIFTIPTEGKTRVIHDTYCPGEVADDAAQVIAEVRNPNETDADPWAGRPVAPEPDVDHSKCGGNGGKLVTCDRCKRTYTCDPWDDYYCAAEGDHCCEWCLIGDRPLVVVDLAVAEVRDTEDGDR